MQYPIFAISAGALAAYLLAWCCATWISRAGLRTSCGEGRLECIDGLRGFLAISVLIHHFVIWVQVHQGGDWTPPAANLLNQLGAGAVALFFMITGYLFYPKILGGASRCSWPAFYLGRMFRILPLVVFSVLLITVAIMIRTDAIIGADYPKAALKWALAWEEPDLLGYADSGRLNAYVLWSLWYEWQFYVFVLPACALASDLVRGRLPSWTVPVGLISASLIGQALRAPLPVLTYLPLFGLGMLASECRRRERIAMALRQPGMTAAAVAALVIGMSIAPTPYGPAMPLFAFFFFCAACGNTMAGVLGSRGAAVLGECSFGVYLLHGLLLSIIFVDAGALTSAMSLDRLPMLLPIAVVIIVPVAAVTCLAIERPAIEVGRRLISLSTGLSLRVRRLGPEAGRTATASG